MLCLLVIDESNWRNDYPDEEEWRSESSSEYVPYSDDENNRYTPDRRYCFGEKHCSVCSCAINTSSAIILCEKVIIYSGLSLLTN